MSRILDCSIIYIDLCSNCRVKAKQNNLELFSGEDISICICLAILTTSFTVEGMCHCALVSINFKIFLPFFCTSIFLFRSKFKSPCRIKIDDMAFKTIFFSFFICKLQTFSTGSFDEGKSYSETRISKLEMRHRLVFICQFAVKARPSRGNLRQVFNFLLDGNPIANSEQFLPNQCTIIESYGATVYNTLLALAKGIAFFLAAVSFCLL